jgi:hypothetical protein
VQSLFTVHIARFRSSAMSRVDLSTVQKSLDVMTVTKKQASPQTIVMRDRRRANALGCQSNFISFNRSM